MAVSKKKRIWIWVGGIFGTIIIILGIAALIISAKWKPLLSEKIKEGVYNASHHLYKIDFKAVNLNLVTGSLALHDVTLMPDSAVYDSLKVKHLAPANLFEIKLKKLQISSVGILTAYFKKRVEVGAIILDNPSINVIFSKVPKKIDTVKVEKTLYQQISQSLKSIHVKTLKIVDADFDYINKSTANRTVNSIKHLDITVRDFLLDSLSQYDTTRFFYTKDVSFQIAGYSSLTKDKMYRMKVDTISGSASSKHIIIKELKLIPLYPELTFARKYKTQKDRYDLSFSKIEFNGVDFLGLSTDQTIHAKALKIGPAKVAVFMSRESPAPKIDKGMNYPHLALKRLDIETIIDTLKLSNVDLKYSEYNPASKKIGTIDFKDLSGHIYNVTNDSLRLTKNHHAVAELNTKLMGLSKLNLKIDFNLTDKNGAFTYSGSMNNFDMKNLNPLSKALGLVEIESGQIQHIDFKANGNQRTATGSMNMLYSNLKIKLLSDNIDGEGTKKKGFLSFLANTLLVKNDNPTKGDPPRTATMSNTRINSASFFNLMWKTVFVGIKDIVGVSIVPNKSPVKQQKVIANKIKEQKRTDKERAKKDKN